MTFGNNQIFLRSTIKIKPSSSMVTKSPVFNQPLTMVSSVAAGILRVARITEPPLTISSPTSPRGSFDHSSSTALASKPGRGIPTLRAFASPGVLTATTGGGFAQSVAFQQFGAGNGFEIEMVCSAKGTAADKQANAVEPSEIPRDFRLAHCGVNRGMPKTRSRVERGLFQNIGKRENGFDQNNRTRHINRQQHHSRQREAVEHRQGKR